MRRRTNNIIKSAYRYKTEIGILNHRKNRQVLFNYRYVYYKYIYYDYNSIIFPDTGVLMLIRNAVLLVTYYMPKLYARLYMWPVY